MSIQINFFKEIKERLSDNVSLVDEVADLMGVSNDSAYRRIRGETELTFAEIKILSNHFRISLDGIIESTSSTVNFHFKSMSERNFSYVSYMESILDTMNNLVIEDESEFIFICNDIPFFHIFHIPEVAIFKSFVWQKTVLGYDEMKGKKFELSRPEESLRNASIGLRDIYAKIPSTEIFHPGTFDVTLNQIEYYSVAGLFQNWKDAILICDKLHELVNHLETQAVQAHKFHPKQELPEIVSKNYSLYFNDVLYIEDAVLINSAETKSVYLINMTLNSLITHSDKFYNHFKKNVENLLAKSTLISGTSEKETSRVFMNYRKKIDKLKDKIIS